MGNLLSEISSRVSSKSLEDLKKSNISDLELLSYTDELYNPSLLQSNSSFDIYEISPQLIVKPNAESLEQEISYAFNYTAAKHATLSSSLISLISSQNSKNPLYEVLEKRLQAICGIHEAFLRQACLKQKLSIGDKASEVITSTLPVSAQLGIGFAVSSLLVLLKRSIKQDPETFAELVKESIGVLSIFPPMSCTIEDPVIGKGMDRISGFFESALKGELKGVTTDMQLVGISPLLGMALVNGNVTSVFSIILKFLEIGQDKGFNSVFQHILPMVKELSKVATARPVLHIWEQAKGSNIAEDKTTATGSQEQSVIGENFSTGLRYYEVNVIELTESIRIGICDGETMENSCIYVSDGNVIVGNSGGTFERYAGNDVIGIFVDFSNCLVTFYKNQKTVFGPCSFGFRSARVYCSFAGTGKVSLISPQVPEGIGENINITSENVLVNPLFDRFQTKESELSSSARASPQLLAAFLLACIEKNNEKHLVLLETQGKSATVKAKEPLSLDLREESLKYLWKILKIASSTTFSAELSQTILSSGLNLLKCHLFALRNFPNIQISEEFKTELYEALQEIYSGKFEIPIKKQAGNILSAFFEFFFAKPQDQINFLVSILKNYKKAVKVKSEESTVIREMVKNVSSPICLFSALSLENNEESVVSYMELLLDLSFKFSQGDKRETLDNQVVLTALSSSLNCLLSQFAVSNFFHQSAILSVSKKLLEVSSQLFKTFSLTGDLQKKVQNSLLHSIFTTFLTALVLCKLDLAFITEIFQPLLSFFSLVNSLQSALPEVTEFTSSQTTCYESEHPYPNSSDSTYVLKVPYSKRHILTFDSNCNTESNCDTLKLFADEGKNTLLYTWSGTGFPTSDLEEKSPVLCFEFHSDGSVNNWGYKILIKTETTSKTYKSFWPSDLTMALRMFISTLCKKLICFEFEKDLPEKIGNIINSPLCKNGIRDKTLGLFEDIPSLPEDLVALSLSEEKKSLVLTGVNKKLMHKERKNDDLASYCEGFGSWPKNYSDVPIVEELIQGSDRIIGCWRDMKQAAGVKGPVSTIGGTEMNQAERTVFAVYISLFDITDLASQVFSSNLQVGKALKYMTKQACNIRAWAQKRKQELIDSGKIIGYSDISKDIVEKSVMILNSDYRKGLIEAGVNTKLIEVPNALKSTTINASSSSKWKTVKGAIEAIQKLSNLLSIIKPKTMENDIIEISKIWKLVMEVYNSEYSVQEILKLLEKRRVRGLSRALGYRYLNLLSMSSINCEVLEVFNQGLKVQNVKCDITKGLEAADPSLINCVRSDFFAVYKLFLAKLTDFNPETVFDLHLILNLLEALNYPIRDQDLHFFLDFNISGLIKKILEYSKGNFSSLKPSKKFSIENCATSFKLLTSSDINSIEIPDTDSLHLQWIIGENKNPISEIKWSRTLLPDYEDAVGPITILSETKYILLKRSNPAASQRYLLKLSPSLEANFQEFSFFCTQEDPEEKLRISQLKMKISNISFTYLKLLLTSLTSENLQETMIHELFKEFTDVKSSFSLSLEETCKGNTWIGNINVPTSLQRNPMDRFLKKFYKETEKGLGIRNIIEAHVRVIDHGLKGILSTEDEGALGEDAKKWLKKHLEVRNSRGQVDFFAYLRAVYAKSKELDELSASYLDKSPLFQNLPQDFYEAQRQSTLSNISHITVYAISQSTTPDFITFLSAFTESEVPGLTSTGSFPEDFKNSEGLYDLYLGINKIASDPDKFASYYSDVQVLIEEFGNFPQSCLSINSEQTLIEDYQGTLLWLIFSQCRYLGTLQALSRKERLAILLKKTISNSQELSALSMLILSQVLPSQHSFESASEIWRKIIFPSEVPKELREDFIKFLFQQIGNSVGFSIQKDSWTGAKRASVDCLDLLQKLVKVARWKEKVLEKIKEITGTMNKKLESLEVINEIDVGVLLFLAMNGNSYSGIDCIVQPLSRVKLENACVGQGIVWVVAEETCKIFSLESESFHCESPNKIVKVLGNSEFFHNLNEPGLYESLLKTWSLIQNFKFECGNTSANLFLRNKIVIKRAECLALESLITLSDQKNGICKLPANGSAVWKRFTAIKENISKKIENRAKAEVTKTLTAEEIQTRIASLDEKKQIICTEVASLGYPANLILTALDSGLSTSEEIIDYITEGNIKPLFNLVKWPDNDLEILDISESSEFYQSSKGHMIITTAVSSIDKKVYSKTMPENLFHNSKFFIDEVTFLISISASTNQHKSEFGVKIGELDIKFESIVENTQIDINGKFSINVNTQAMYVIKIVASASGELEITGENFLMDCKTMENSVFTGCKIGNLSLYLKEGNKLELKGFAVYEGRLEKVLKFFEEDFENQEKIGKFLKVRVVESSGVRSRLEMIGVPFEISKKLSQEYYDLEKCVQEVVKMDPSVWPNPFPSVQSGHIHQVKIFDSHADIEKGFEPVAIFENGELIKTALHGHKVLAVKRLPEVPSKSITEIVVEESTNAELIGDLSSDPQYPTKLFKVSIEKTPSLKNLAFILSKSSQKVAVPLGYTLLSNKEGCKINFSANKSFCLFLAVTNSDYLLSYPIHSLSSLKKQPSSYGLSNNLEVKSESEDTEIYKNFSLLELISSLLDQEELRIQRLGKDFMMSISFQKPEALITSVENKGFSYLLSMFNEDFKELEPFLNAAIKANHKSVIEKILCECIFQLTTANSANGSDGKAKVFESTHSYTSNMDFEEEISFPGATKLIIEFDPQCYTEANCDYLAFYPRPGKENEIKKFSGQGESNWQKFEHTGDKLYLYFHTDSSVVYWGYKFTVTPIIPKKKSNVRKYNIPAVLFIIDFIASNGFTVLTSGFFKQFVVIPLFMFMHTCEDIRTIEMALEVLKKLLTGNEAYQKSIVEIILQQATLIQKSTADGPSSLLTVILSVLCELYKANACKISQPWFIDFYNCYYDMKALSDPTSSFDSFLFEGFKEKLLKSVEKFYESTHPYNREAKPVLVSIPGADSLEVIFDSNSAFEEGDEIFFSKDSEGKIPISAFSNSNKLVTWSDSIKGPDIQLSNSQLTITRTNSSGWGISQSTEVFIGVSLTITISIDSSDVGTYWYIGLVDPTDTINYSSNMANDSGFRLWTWKRSGDFYRSGEQVAKGADFGFGKGDIVQVVVNCPESSVTFVKNGEIMHSFTGISEKTSLAMSFGGSNQVATIMSASAENKSMAPLKKRKVKITGDNMYFHFPINQGIYSSFAWESTNDSQVTMTPISISRVSGEGPSVHLTSTPLSIGRHYCEFEFPGLVDKTLVLVGLVKESIIRNQSVIGNCAGYKNQGGIVIGANSTSCKGFRAIDAIGIYVDFSKPEIRFYKNKLLVSTHRIELTAEISRFAVMLTAIGHEVKIVNNPQVPDDVDMLGLRQKIKFGNSNAWGYKFKVIPTFTDRSPETLEQILKCTGDDDKVLWKEYSNKYASVIRNGAAEEIVNLIDEISVNTGKSSLELQNAEINPQGSMLLHYKCLEGLQVKDIQELSRVFQGFNKNVKSNLCMFDLNIGENPTEIQKAFLTSRKFIFFDIKKTLFNTHLEYSKNDSRPEIVIDRTKAVRYQNQKITDLNGQYSVFGQVLRSMNQRNNSDFRNPERVFKVTYKGEGAIDAGGPYNEVLSIICDELQSTYLPLLVPTQNHTNNIGEFRDSYTINPSLLQSGYELFNFLGKVIGVAIRTQNNLNLSLSPLTWKHLVIDPVLPVDLKSIDEICFQMTEILKSFDEKAITKENFMMAFSEEFFTTRLSNGEVVELVPGGKSVQVTFEKALEYAELIVKARIGEGKEWYKAIRKGISAVIPIDLLNLFSWKQVETLVCGAGDIKIDVLRANTDYSNGTSESDPHIAYFWEVLTEMSSKEKLLFLRFVWGRSRLPASKTFTHMKISKLVPRGPVDKYLPVSHTCFFTIDLPPYNSKEVMREKLLYAITHCTAIDLDTAPASGGWDDNE